MCAKACRGFVRAILEVSVQAVAVPAATRCNPYPCCRLYSCCRATPRRERGQGTPPQHRLNVPMHVPHSHHPVRHLEEGGHVDVWGPHFLLPERSKDRRQAPGNALPRPSAPGQRRAQQLHIRAHVSPRANTNTAALPCWQSPPYALQAEAGGVGLTRGERRSGALAAAPLDASRSGASDGARLNADPSMHVDTESRVTSVTAAPRPPLRGLRRPTAASMLESGCPLLAHIRCASVR